jgi:hypothetical protein
MSGKTASHNHPEAAEHFLRTRRVDSRGTRGKKFAARRCAAGRRDCDAARQPRGRSRRNALGWSRKPVEAICGSAGSPLIARFC